MNGSVYLEARNKLTYQQKFDFALTLETEAIFMIASKLLSQPVYLSDFNEIVVDIISESEEVDIETFKALFDEHYLKFLTQSYHLPANQFAKLKYTFNLIKVPLGEALVTNKDALKRVYNQLSFE